MIHPLGIISLITTVDKYGDEKFNIWYDIWADIKVKNCSISLDISKYIFIFVWNIVMKINSIFS